MAHPEQQVTRVRSVSDLVLAIIAIVGGIAVIIYASGMKTLSTGQMGPGLFPSLIGWLFVVFGGILLVQSLRGRMDDAATEDVATIHEAETETALVDESEGGSYAIVDESPGRLVVNGLVVVLGIVFYILLADTLGFSISLFAVLSAIMLTLREKVWRALVFSAVITAVIFFVFEKGLLVQLPNGFVGF
ncbi:tripartite tricarboxylate transporter TctB family protein [Flaviflexus equikiangi]|uniref:Tripartite tricarboxylate transporter TctB family protein n=1 Tax=Flaviflexus equikiangi TaxID=2758573 RepID=A0ABS2TK51_9ACTO|nr:tripartite tricarboxylate transporter TctB family protein [Flaviflexus equikiangi]MBM9433649.1 tripartite tricarboxylate transporter TctB family protein [Flaviflexus equikiangi]